METVRQVLAHKGAEVHTIAPGATVLDALRLMADRDLGALVVVDDGRVIGVLSERDYSRKVILAGRRSESTAVRDVMVGDAVCVGPEHTVTECMALMTEKRTRHLPVLDAGQLVGIVSIGDLVRSIIADQQFTIEQLEHYIAGTS